jgi:hypothetical protein
MSSSFVMYVLRLQLPHLATSSFLISKKLTYLTFKVILEHMLQKGGFGLFSISSIVVFSGLNA